MSHATKASALAAARNKWGKAAFVREDPHAPTAAQRAMLMTRGAELRERVKVIDSDLKALGAVLPALITAARFAVDVDGGPPSLEQLRAAVEKAERRDELNEERRACRAEHDGLQAWRRRWDAGDVGEMFRHSRVSADTLDELIEKIEAKS